MNAPGATTMTLGMAPVFPVLCPAVAHSPSSPACARCASTMGISGSFWGLKCASGTATGSYWTWRRMKNQVKCPNFHPDSQLASDMAYLYEVTEAAYSQPEVPDEAYTRQQACQQYQHHVTRGQRGTCTSRKAIARPVVVRNERRTPPKRAVDTGQIPAWMGWCTHNIIGGLL